jgi:kynureninase
VTDFQDDAAWAIAQDRADPLWALRSEFALPLAPDGSEGLYFCGHSLGAMPRRARDYVNEELDDWARLGVEGHFAGKHPWMPYHQLLTDSTARLVGALPSEVVVMNTLTVNLHLMMLSFYRPSPKRHRILIEGGAFPSDQYAVDSQVRLHGYDPREAVLEASPRAGESVLQLEDLLALIERDGESIALVLLGVPNYLTGQALDRRALVRAAHGKGCQIGFDLAHGTGNLLVALHDEGPDFAVWCNYKYLNAGPGGLGGAFVHQRWENAPGLPRLAGWWGHDQESRFAMGRGFVPTPGAQGWQLSNPPIFQLAALRASMELFDRAGIANLRARGDRLTGYLEFLLEKTRGPFELVTPRHANERGSMLTLRVKPSPRGGAKELVEFLGARGTLVDLRNPDLVRITPAPLYNSMADVQSLGKLLQEFWS